MIYHRGHREELENKEALTDSQFFSVSSVVN